MARSYQDTGEVTQEVSARSYQTTEKIVQDTTAAQAQPQPPPFLTRSIARRM